MTQLTDNQINIKCDNMYKISNIYVFVLFINH